MRQQVSRAWLQEEIPTNGTLSTKIMAVATYVEIFAIQTHARELAGPLHNFIALAINQKRCGRKKHMELISKLKLK
jgi:hypothetical protein